MYYNELRVNKLKGKKMSDIDRSAEIIAAYQYKNNNQIITADCPQAKAILGGAFQNCKELKTAHFNRVKTIG